MKTDNAKIQVDGLAGGYGGTLVLENISFAIKRGEVVAILGGSGCGKSTLMNLMIGLQRPWRGHIYYSGRDLTTAAGADYERIMHQIGVAFQGGALFGSMTVLDNVTLAMESFTDDPPSLQRAVASVKLRLVGLAGYENHLPSELSGGMQKRAAVARAMALDPEILFLDEPSAGLDPVTAAQLDDLILQLRDSFGMTVVIVTHELASIMAIADRVIMLDKSVKGIIAEGKPQELQHQREQPLVWQFFNRTASMEHLTNDTEAS
ncbi:ABC transporter ATP-binding protein [Planctomycetota bacterium]